MVWLSDSEKKFEDVFTSFVTIQKRDGRTPRSGIGRAVRRCAAVIIKETY